MVSLSNRILEIESELFRVSSMAVEERVFPGCVVGVTDYTGLDRVFCFGSPVYDTVEGLRPDSIFDAASVTKSIPVSTIALKAFEERRVAPDDSVQDIVPEFTGRYSDRVLFQHLLTHTLDFDMRLSSLKGNRPEEILDSVMRADLRSEPGTSFVYCNATSILLGIAIERLYAMRLDEIAERLIFTPLKMHSTGFNSENGVLSGVVPTEIDSWRGREIRGEVHDESAWKLSRIMTPGSAGIFTTAGDLNKFMRMLLFRGVSESGERILEQETIESIPVNRIPHLKASAGMGWELNERRYMGENVSDRTIGKTGFTGCVVVCDFSKGRAMVMLSNFTYPHRESTPERINMVRRKFCDIVFK